MSNFVLRTDTVETAGTVPLFRLVQRVRRRASLHCSIGCTGTWHVLDS
jgi:hypothetical protein